VVEASIQVASVTFASAEMASVDLITPASSRGVSCLLADAVMIMVSDHHRHDLGPLLPVLGASTWVRDLLPRPADG